MAVRWQVTGPQELPLELPVNRRHTLLIITCKAEVCRRGTGLYTLAGAQALRLLAAMAPQQLLGHVQDLFPPVPACSSLLVRWAIISNHDIST
jgi:hypothetical protein